MPEAVEKAPMTAEERQASAVLERIFRNAPFIHGTADHPQFLNDAKVEVHTQYHRYDVSDKVGESLIITMTDPHAEHSPQATSDFLLKQLSQLPLLKDKVTFLPATEQQKATKALLEKLIVEGAVLSKGLAEWPGFNAERYDRKDHAISVRKHDDAVTMAIDIPKGSAVSVNEVVQDVQSRLPQIKEVLATRLAKYTGGVTEASVQAIRAQIEQMEFSVSRRESEWQDTVEVIIRSPEQVAALKAPGGIEAATNREALRASNPLMALSDTEQDPRLQKALARAYFAGGAIDERVMAAVIGADDMRQLLTKELGKLEAAKPHLKAEIEQVLNGDALKVHKRGKSHDQQEPQSMGKVSLDKPQDKAGILTVTIQLPYGTPVLAAIKAIAGLDPQPGQQHPHFAKVGSVELIGASSPEAAQSAMKILEQVPHVASPPALEQALTPLAEQLVQHIEAAHKAVETAVNMAAGHAAGLKATVPSLPPGQPDSALTQVRQCTPAASHLSMGA